MEKTKITKKTILVTGGAGYLGSALTGLLLSHGYKVKVLDKLLFGNNSLDAYNKISGFSLIVGDIRDKRTVEKAVSNVSALCHLAALVGEPACGIDPKESYSVNVEGTNMLLDCSQNEGIRRFIFASTCSNYGVTPNTQLAREDMPLKPLSIYAKTKIEAEEKVLKKGGVVLRFATLFGISPRMRFNLLVNELVRDGVYGKTLKIYKPYSGRPFLHILDASEAILKVIESEKDLKGEIFNVVGENTRKLEIVKKIKKHFPDTKVRFEQKGDDRDYMVSSEKIKRMLHFRARRSINFGIKEIIKALKEGICKNPYSRRYTAWL